MREYEKFLPEMNGVKLPWYTDPEDVVMEDHEDYAECEHCDAVWDDDSDMGMIEYREFGRTKYCCADCFYSLIGWRDMMVCPDDREPFYDEARTILRNKTPGKTGIPVVDNHLPELLEYLDRMLCLLEMVEETEGKINRMKGVA